MPPKKYTKEDLEKALSLIASGQLSQNQAAKEFQVPVMTLSDHMNGKVSVMFLV